jgi:heme oxygenase (biliverdin-IX-beta and delta-forming)
MNEVISYFREVSIKISSLFLLMPLTLEPAAVMLKKATAERHIDVEKTMNPRIGNIRSMEDYASLLKTYFGFYFPLQNIISEVINDADLADIDERKHASLILEDLHSIGQPITSLPICEDLPTIINKAQAFGCMYVMEGSTLGGRVICKWLQKNPFIQLKEENLQFFNGYKEQTGSKWKTFLDALNDQPDINAVTDAANETFLLFQNWITTTSK